MIPRRLIPTVTLFLILNLAALAAQTIRVDVLLQQVIATVTDPDGHLVTHLLPEDFIVDLDGVRQQISHFSVDQNVATSVGLIVDRSYSMKPILVAAMAAAATFINGMQPSDESFLMTFNTKATVRQGFTHHPTRLFDALQDVTAAGGTDIVESITEAANKMTEASNPKHALIVISDGEDLFATESEIQSFQEHLGGMETLIYAIHIQDAQAPAVIPKSPPPHIANYKLVPTAASTPSLAKELMESLALRSGGKYFYMNADRSPEELSRQLRSIFEDVFIELKQQYTRGFYRPPGSNLSSTVRIATLNPNYRVRASFVRPAVPILTNRTQ